MKNYFIPVIAIFMFCPAILHADAPATTCPAGYKTIYQEYTIIGTSCPSGYVNAGSATSCLISNPGGQCIMYAPAGVTYTDDTGSYEYTSACPLE